MAISDKKIIPRKTELTDNWFVPAEFRLFLGTENSWNSVQNHSAEEKNVWNSVTWNKIEANSRNSVPYNSAEENQRRIPFRGTVKEANSRNSVPKHILDKNTLSILFAEAGFFGKPILFVSFSSVPSCGIDSSINLGMTTYFHGITEIILSLFCGIFSERNSVANPTFNQ
jgi:hypothetical protein